MEIVWSTRFKKWISSLRDKTGQRRILYALEKSQSLGFIQGDTKNVGDGVYEMRFHFGPGYRVYYTSVANLTVFLLAGGDKSSQTKDIQLAKQMAHDLKEGDND